MTLDSHFTLNFHYYEQRFQNLFYILITEPIYRIFLLSCNQQRCAEADRDPQNIWDLQNFRRRKVASTISSEP